MIKKVNEVELSMDADTLNKVRGKLKPTDKINLTDKPSSSSVPTSQTTSPTTMAEDIEPQDKETIKYLSNVKGEDGQVSKPFTIGGKNYQMVRGITTSKEVVMAVYCQDDVNESGENIIHSIEEFEKNIANPAKNEMGQALPLVNKADTVATTMPKTEEAKPEVKQDASLKLSEFKHFVIDSKTGKVRKFKRAEELAKANMTETETYMNLKQFKKHVDETLFGTKQRKSEVNEAEPLPEKPDVIMAIEQMVAKMKPYMSKINEPIEKIQFLVKLFQMLQLDASKLPMLMSAIKKAGNATFGSQNSTSSQTTQTTQTSIAESKIITKNDLIESIQPKKVNKVIKFKDIK